MSALETMTFFNSAMVDKGIGWRITPEFTSNDKYAGLTLTNADFGDDATYETDDKRPAVGFAQAMAFINGFEAGVFSEQEVGRHNQFTMEVLANWKTRDKTSH